MANPRSPNLLLATLPLSDYDLLDSHLTAVDLINETGFHEVPTKSPLLISRIAV
jgi:hypothetical protein